MVSTGYDGMFEFAAGRCGPRPFGKLRRRLSGFAAKEARKIARAHGDAIREGGYAEIVPRVPQNPGLKFVDVWPVLRTSSKAHYRACRRVDRPQTGLVTVQSRGPTVSRFFRSWMKS